VTVTRFGWVRSFEVSCPIMFDLWRGP